MAERKNNNSADRQADKQVHDGIRPKDRHPESPTPVHLRPDDQVAVEGDLRSEAARESAIATADDTLSGVKAENEKKMAYYEASQWQLMRRRFQKHKMAFWMFHVLVVLYVICMNCEFFSPYYYETIHSSDAYQPPQPLKFSFSEGIYVHPFKMQRHPVTRESRYYLDYEQRVPLKFLARGFKYELFGFIPTDRHLFGTDQTRPFITEGENKQPLQARLESDGRKDSGFNRVIFENANLSRVKYNDVLHLISPGGDEVKTYRVSRVLSTQEIELFDAIDQQPAEGSTFEIHRPERIFLLGTDGLGRDMLSRIISGGRISLLLGLTGVLVSFCLGITLGGLSGYYGGWIDMGIQRMAEIIQSIPSIPIWLALGAAIPRGWSPLQVYFGMTLILACMGWTGLCRVVRGKLLSLREEDYARAALLAGASERRIIFMHLIPNFTSHIIASLTLAIPGMILAETSLSFLGLGLRPPVVSWGVLLQQANSVQVVKNQPWLLLPAAMVVVAVLAFNFIGEGLRDAADPYSS